MLLPRATSVSFLGGAASGTSGRHANKACGRICWPLGKRCRASRPRLTRCCPRLTTPAQPGSTVAARCPFIPSFAAWAGSFCCGAPAAPPHQANTRRRGMCARRGLHARTPCWARWRWSRRRRATCATSRRSWRTTRATTPCSCTARREAARAPPYVPWRLRRTGWSSGARAACWSCTSTTASTPSPFSEATSAGTSPASSCGSTARWRWPWPAGTGSSSKTSTGRRASSSRRCGPSSRASRCRSGRTEPPSSPRRASNCSARRPRRPSASRWRRRTTSPHLRRPSRRRRQAPCGPSRCPPRRFSASPSSSCTLRCRH